MQNHEIIGLDTLPNDMLKLIVKGFSNDELKQLALVSSAFHKFIYGCCFHKPYKQICLFNEFIKVMQSKELNVSVNQFEKDNTVTLFKPNRLPWIDKIRFGASIIIIFILAYLLRLDVPLVFKFGIVVLAAGVAITFSKIKADANEVYAQGPIDLNYLGEFRRKHAFFKGLDYSTLSAATTRAQAIQFHKDIIANISKILELFPQYLPSIIESNKLEIDSSKLVNDNKQREILNLFLNLWNEDKKEEIKLSLKL